MLRALFPGGLVGGVVSAVFSSVVISCRLVDLVVLMGLFLLLFLFALLRMGYLRYDGFAFGSKSTWMASAVGFGEIVALFSIRFCLGSVEVTLNWTSYIRSCLRSCRL